MKFGCTASIRLSEVITYPSYKVLQSVNNEMMMMMKMMMMMMMMMIIIIITITIAVCY